MQPLGRAIHLAIGLAVGALGVTGAAGAFGVARQFWSVSDWPAATAEIIDILPAGGIDAGYRLRVRYLPQGAGMVETDTADLIGADQLRILREVAPSPGGAAVNPTALIYYSPDRPQQVRLSRLGRGGAQSYALVLTAAGLAATAAAIWGLYRGFSRARSPRSGNTAPGNS